MYFILHYQGPLKSNGDAKHKNQIREYFHPQLSELWSQPQICSNRDRAFKNEQSISEKSKHLDTEITENSQINELKKSQNKIEQHIESAMFPSLLKDVEGKYFVPLVCKKLDLVAELNITMLRTDAPGNIISQGGDIDNRIKTLLDALSVPDTNQVKKFKEDCTILNPVNCLLEDDSLITKLSISTSRLLNRFENNSDVILLIGVTTQRVIQTVHNLSFY